MQISGHAALVTGGGSGLGEAVARAAAIQGARVAVLDINEAGARETAAMLPAGQSSTHKLDVRDREAWDTALADCAKASGGKIDVMFNNAGIPLGGSLIENTVGEIERCLDINLKGTMLCTQAVIAPMRAQGGGAACWWAGRAGAAVDRRRSSCQAPGGGGALSGWLPSPARSSSSPRQ